MDADGTYLTWRGQEPSEPLSAGEPFTIGICTVLSGDRTAASHETNSRVNNDNVMRTDEREWCSNSDPRRARSRFRCS